MKNLNYALAGGDKPLLTAQALDGTVAFQLWYTGIVATTVSIEVWVSTDINGPYAKIDEATKTLVPSDGTAVITLSGTSYLFIQFRLLTGGVTVGTITRADALNVSNTVY